MICNNGDYPLDKVEGEAHLPFKEVWRLYKVVSLFEPMKQYAHEYFVLASALKDMMVVSHRAKEVFGLSGSASTDITDFSLEEIFERMANSCKVIGLSQSLKQVERSQKSLYNLIPQGLTKRDLPDIKKFIFETHKAFEIINGRISDELEDVQFLHVSHPEYYEVNQISNEIISKLNAYAKSDLIYDIQEAGKCFALDRHTACVFHLMRIVEAGLNAIKAKFNIDKFDPTWDSVVKTLTKYADGIKPTNESGNYPNAIVEWRKLNKDIQEVNARIIMIKDSWRNETMHVVRKYNAEEALEAFSATKYFLSAVAGKFF